MSIEIIDILKPKNGLSFKLIEDIDIAVQGYTSLADAVSHFVTTESIQQIINAALSGKQDTLTTEQLAACNSGITSELVTQIGTNTTAIAGKASQADLDSTNAALAGKANASDVATATASLQSQMDAVAASVGSGTADTEIAQARVDSDGVTYTTLKGRIDSIDNDIDNYLSVQINTSAIANWYNYGIAYSNVTHKGSASPSSTRLSNVTSLNHKNDLHQGDTITINLVDSTNYKYAVGLFSGDELVQGTWGYNTSSTTITVNQDCYLVVMIANTDDTKNIDSTEASNVIVTAPHLTTELDISRVNAVGETYINLKARLDADYNTLDGKIDTAEQTSQQLFESLANTVASRPYDITNWYNYQIVISAVQGNSVSASTKRLSNITSFDNVNNLNTGDMISITLLDPTNYKYAYVLMSGNTVVQGTWSYHNSSTTVEVEQSSYLAIMVSNVDGDADVSTSEAASAIKVSVNPSYFPKMKWLGQSAVFVGDSITYGVNTQEGQIYWQYLAAKCGFTATGMGVAGSCWSITSDYGSTNDPIASRWNDIPEKDLICIFAGTNDYGHNTPLGTINDATDISFYGALNVVVGGLLNKYPYRRLCLMTPLHRYNFGGLTYDTENNSEGHNLYDYVNAIKAIGEKYGVPVIDTFSVSGLNPIVPAIKNDIISDGLHPNARGHYMIANRTYGLFNNL